MTTVGTQLDRSTPGAVWDAARALADGGATGDSVLSRPGGALSPPLRAALATMVRPPDPAVGYRVVPGLLDAFDDPGPTPLHWSEADRCRTAAFDIAMVLVASVLGDVFGWVNQQNGRLVHNIVPSPGCEEMQIGASSTAALAWHSEDAFHPERADYLLLACVRNPDRIGSSLSTVARAGLTPDQITQLSRPELVVLPDASYEDTAAAGTRPVGMATVWHRDGRPCLRYDPAYTHMLSDDAPFRRAYADLGRQLEENRVIVALEPGDLLIIDNDVTVHGRSPFQARYDGTDRWLKRVLVRASRARPERLEHGYGQRRVNAETGHRS